MAHSTTLVALDPVQPRKKKSNQPSKQAKQTDLTFALNDFRRKVLGRAAERPGAVCDDLGKAKVCDFDVPVHVDQEVFGLEVAIHNVLIKGARRGEARQDKARVKRARR